MRLSALRNVVKTASSPSRHGQSQAASIWEWPMICSTRRCCPSGTDANADVAAAALSVAALRNRKSRRESSYHFDILLHLLKPLLWVTPGSVSAAIREA